MKKDRTTKIYLTNRDMELFKSKINNPPEPNSYLISLVMEYKSKYPPKTSFKEHQGTRNEF